MAEGNLGSRGLSCLWGGEGAKKAPQTSNRLSSNDVCVTTCLQRQRKWGREKEAPDFLPATKQQSSSIDEIIISSLCLLGTVCWDWATKVEPFMWKLRCLMPCDPEDSQKLPHIQRLLCKGKWDQVQFIVLENKYICSCSGEQVLFKKIL